MRKAQNLQDTQNFGHVLLHEPLPDILAVHQFQRLDVNLNVVAVGDLHHVRRRRPRVMRRPPVGELHREEPAVRNQNLAMNVHGDANPILGTQRELDVARNGVVELVPGAPRRQDFRYPLHH